jgi:hypothetical protein
MKKQQQEAMYALLLRLELWFAPLLILVPIFVSFFFIQDWYVRGAIMRTSRYDGELILGLVILFGNLPYDILFMKSIRSLKRKKIINENATK